MLEQIESAFAARARSEAAAREAEARARQSEERMRQFVADASHELRTPLTSIRGFAELYRQGAVSSPEDTAALLGRIENEAARMGLLVEDLLLLARLDQQRPLDDEPVELAVVVSDSVEAARAVEPERPITVELPDGTARLVVRGDDARLRQVVGNLLSNALTHTPPGTPVSVRLYAENGLAVVEVADKGPGLAPEQAERVFERFYRADAARGRPARRAGAASMGGGTGLGLAIVAAITEAHGGSVQLDTEPGRGATFRVRLPLADREFVTMDREQQPRAERGDDGE
jgi:two-component system OmpR family sensor kinase